MMQFRSVRAQMIWDLGCSWASELQKDHTGYAASQPVPSSDSRA